MPTRVQPATMRQRALDTAAELFTTHGFVQTPLSAIASRLQVTKAALYYHFSSKDDLLVALVTPLLDRIDATLEEFEASADSAGSRDELLARYAELLDTGGPAVRLLSRDINVARHPQIQPRINDHQRRLIDALSGPQPTLETVARAAAATTLVQRGLVGTQERHGLLSEVTTEEHRAILVRLAIEILDRRFDG